MTLAQKKMTTVSLASVAGLIIVLQYFMPSSVTLFVVAIAVFLVTAPMAVYYRSQRTDWGLEAESIVMVEKVKNNIDEERTDAKAKEN